MLLITQVEDIRKPEILGRIFTYLVKDKISPPQYEELVLAVKKVNVNYLNDLSLFYSYSEGGGLNKLIGRSEKLVQSRVTSRSALQNLIQSGLIDLSCMPSIIVSDADIFGKELDSKDNLESWKIDPVTANGKIIVEIIKDTQSIFS